VWRLAALALPAAEYIIAGLAPRRGEAGTGSPVSFGAPGLPLLGLPPRTLLALSSDGAGGVALLAIPPDARPVELQPGVPSNELGSLEYTFDGRRSVTGITIRRDPGAGLIWPAVALLLVGQGITFYVPSARLWLRLVPAAVQVAAQAGSGAALVRLGDDLTPARDGGR
jgi:hypothetical protein